MRTRLPPALTLSPYRVSQTSDTMTIPEVAAVEMPASSLPQVTDQELGQYSELIYRRTGIRIAPQKKMLLSNRLRRRLRATGVKDFRTYFEHLGRLQSTDPEWDAFLQEITTHETYLFRDMAHWDWFREGFLPQCASEARDGRRPASLRIWSAACSTGDEATTAACCIAACLPNFERWRITILGTDIGVGAVSQAKAAEFGERAMRLVPESYCKRFFSRAVDAPVWRARSTLTDMLTFRQHNLMDPLAERPFDLVFLKNVLIYFDKASKTRVMSNVRSAIRPGGLLVAGAAEGVSDLVRDCIRMQPWLYQQPDR